MMLLLQGMNLKKSFDQGLSYLFQEVSFTLAEGKHIALVGANGSGKSTLLKIIAGVEDVSGTLQQKRGLKIGYQVQEPCFDPAVTVQEVLQGCFSKLLELHEQIGKLEEQMAGVQGDELAQVLDAYGRSLHEFEILGGYTYEQEMRKVATGLGLREEEQNRSAASLSGGEKSKLLLACQLLEKPDVLLLDEPTNHLDVESLEWLEAFLQAYAGTYLIVSHDRYFLDQVAEEIWELERGQFYLYTGNYSQYVEEKERRLKNHWVEYEKQQKVIANLTQQAHEQRINSLKAERNATLQDGDASFFKRKAKKVMKKAKVAEAKREKLLTEKHINKPFELQPIRLQFPVEVRARGIILHVKELAMAYDPARLLFRDLAFTLHAGTRLGIIGPNGAGKTTLLKLILGNLEPLQGEVVRSGRLKIGHYSQEQETLVEELSALDNILASCPVDETTARTMLGTVRIEKEKVHVLVRNLSGGEKSKVQLCKILLSGANLLVLDEPTNHLDIDCREAVENALQLYPGAMVFISHDRYFIQKLAQQLVYINGEESKVHLGDYTSFRNQYSGQDHETRSPEQMVRETRLLALTGQLSSLHEGQTEEKARIEAEILALEQENDVSFQRIWCKLNIKK